MQNAHVIDQSYSVSLSSRGQTDTRGFRVPDEQKQVFTINHIVKMNYLAMT